MLISVANIVVNLNMVRNCHQSESGQGGDIADDRLPKAELWWADRGAEAEGKKEAVLENHFGSSSKKQKCLSLDFFFCFCLFRAWICLEPSLIILLDGLQEPELSWRAGGGGTLGRFTPDQNHFNSKSKSFGFKI